MKAVETELLLCYKKLTNFSFLNPYYEPESQKLKTISRRKVIFVGLASMFLINVCYFLFVELLTEST